MTEPDNKHLVLIVSAGRTGTRFFGDLLASMIPGSYSVHEPDVLDGFTWRTVEAIRTFGFRHMLVDRALGRSGLRNLSTAFLSGELNQDEVAKIIYDQRSRYYNKISSDLIIESNYQWFGILPVAPKLFPKFKMVAISRDPRSWVTSCMNFGRLYGPRDFVSRFGFKRLNPGMIDDAPYKDQWPRMSSFERLCWTWAAINRILLDYLDGRDNARLWRYEDLFLSGNREAALRDMLEFITTFPDAKFSFELNPDLLTERRHASGRKHFPDWPAWPDDHKTRLYEICGPMMKALGYESGPEKIPTP